MIYDLFCSIVFRCLFIVISVTLLIFLIVYMSSLSRKRIEENKKDFPNQEMLKKISNKKNWVFYFIVIFLLVNIWFVCNCYKVSVEQYKYSSTIENNRHNIEDFFVEKKYEHVEEESLFSEEWYQDNVKEVGELEIDENICRKYANNVEQLFFKAPDKVNESETLSDELKRKKEQFYKNVSKGTNELSMSECWETYLLGQEIMLEESKSDVIFQAAVFAEAAHEKGYDSISNLCSKEYMEGAVDGFKNFLAFEIKDAGGNIVSEESVVLRIGKILLREALHWKQEDSDYYRHLLLCAFFCFRYARKNIENLKTYLGELLVYYEGYCCTFLICETSHEELENNDYLRKEIFESTYKLFDEFTLDERKEIVIESHKKGMLEEIKRELEYLLE